MRRFLSFPLALVIPFAVSLAALAAQDPPATEKATEKSKPDAITLETLFPKKGLFGPTASGMAFSHDGAHAAWLWRTNDERRHGGDLWLLEVASGKVTRVTDVHAMAQWQASARKVVEHFATKAKEAAQKAGKPVPKGKPPLPPKDADDEKAPRYAGIQSFSWSPTANELMFQAEGDVYRFEIGKPEFTRLTMTRRGESSVQYLPDGSGYTFLSEGALIRVRFGSHLVEQIDPKLPAGETMTGYRLSQDGRFLTFLATKRGAATEPNRRVGIASYRDRFLKVNEVPRTVSDDPLPEIETSVYLYEMPGDMKEDGDPTRVHQQKVSGPRDVLRTPRWSLDSKRIAFASFDQATSQVRVLIAEVGADPKPGEKRKPPETAKIVYRFLHDGGPNTPGMIEPDFLADGRRLLLLTEQSGFRHLHVLDPLWQSLQQVTSGRHEVYPIGMTKDRTRAFFAATREHPSRVDVYELKFDDGAITRVSRSDGEHGDVAVSPDGRTLLSNFGRYGELRELRVVDAVNGVERVLTDSHRKDVQRLVAPRPELFAYTNRHGHEIQAMMFKPDDWSPADRRPLLVYVYGGPLGTRKQVVEGNYHADSYFFAWWMAKRHGYVTVTIDPRGMSGYGGLFEKSNYEQVGKPQVEDLVDGVRWLAANAGVDDKRVGIHGWSFGGFQTQMCMYTEPDVFQVGIAGAGPTEWENYNSWYSTGTIGPSRPGQTDLKKFSLLPLAKNLKGRLMLVHGMEDPNVLYQDTVRVYRELLKAGKETLVELFLDPTGGHGLGGDVERLAKARKYEDYLLRHLGRGEAARPELATPATNAPTATPSSATTTSVEPVLR